MVSHLLWKHLFESPFVLGVVQDIFHCTVLVFGPTKEIPVLHWDSRLLDVDMKCLDWAILPEFVVNTKNEVVLVLLNLRCLWTLSIVKWTLSLSRTSPNIGWLVTVIIFSGFKDYYMLRESTSRPKNSIFCWRVRMDLMRLITTRKLHVATRKLMCLLLSESPWLTSPAIICHLDK